MRRRRIGVIGAVLGALVVIGIALGALLHTGESGGASAPGAAGARLERSLGVVNSFATPSGYPYGVSLTSDLQTVDPRTPYQVLASPSQVPSPGAIGIYTSGYDVWLRTTGSGRSIVELRHIAAGTGAGTYGPVTVSDLAVSDGDFYSPLVGVWSLQVGATASIHRDTNVSASSPASLRIGGSGRRGQIATTVSQVLPQAVPARPGTVYQVGLQARTRNLSRPLSVELKLLYTDGSYQFFGATSQTDPTVVGIPSGTSRGWVPLSILGTARKPVASAILFAADTGVQPLSGSAWVDDFVLSKTP